MQSSASMPASFERAQQSGGWGEGYTTTLDYVFGYNRELNPVCLPLAFLEAGLVPPDVRSACELGFGQGFSVNIHAAGSNCAWYGTDFNPAHAAVARSLASASGASAQLFDQSFDEFCRRGDLPDFDFICLHGIWSWISHENRQVIVDFVRRKLRVGGVLLISYNTQPGWAAVLPIRDLLTRHIEVMTGTGHAIDPGIADAFAFVEKLLVLAPKFVRAHPVVAEWIEQTRKRDSRYLAHEYFNRHWHPTPFAELAESLTGAKLTFVASADPLERVTALHLTSAQQAALTEIPDAVFREAVRDFMVNRLFRRDYWIKGPRRLSAAERLEAIRQQRIMLTTHRPDVGRTVSGGLGGGDMAANIFEPLLDALADHAPRTVGQIADAMEPRGLRFGQVYEALTVLEGKRDVFPVQDDAAQTVAEPRTEKLNRYIIDKSRSNPEWLVLASPVTGGGVPVPRAQQLFLLALANGRKTPDEWAQTAWQVYSTQKEGVVKDGKPLKTAEENVAELTARAHEFAAERLPILRALQIA